MCGIFGLHNKEDVAFHIYYALMALQHRGQEGAGITVYDGKKLVTYKDTGLVAEVFKGKDLKKLKGRIGIGHTRYSTAGCMTREGTQPINIKVGETSLAIGHNGNIVNVRKLVEKLGRKFVNDSEMIGYMVAQELEKGAEIIEAIEKTCKQLNGAYSLVMLYNGKLIGVRDPYGIRPLVIGEFDGGYALASESAAFDMLKAKLVGDVEPGSIVVIDNGLEKHKFADEEPRHCMFEYVYFARPDSIINGVNVYEARRALGYILAEEHPVEADRIVPVPDSGRSAAVAYARKTDIKYSEGLMKNRYIARTFIEPIHEMRETMVRMKMNPIRFTVNNRRIVFIDDSIVRSTTSKRLVAILREAGASEVHVRVASPPIKYPCPLGIDFPTRKELIASNKTVPEVCEEIGADSLGYISIEGLVRGLKLEGKLCLACLTGEYPNEEIKEIVLGARGNRRLM